MTNNTAIELLELPDLQLTPERKIELSELFLTAIKIRGDFPTSLSLLEKIGNMIDSGATSSQEIATMLRVDQILALRLIALVNLDFYSSGKTLLSISSAVDHFGLIRLKEILPSLAEAKNFNAIFLGHAVALGMMQQSSLACVLAQSLVTKISSKKEDSDLAYTLTVLSNLGLLLLSYYEPAMYSVLDLACQHNYSETSNNFSKFTGQTISQFAVQAVSALQLPDKYSELASHLDAELDSPNNLEPVLKSVLSANMLAHEICHFSGIQGVQNVIRKLADKFQIEQIIFEDILNNIGNTYLQHTDTLALKAMRLPEYLAWFAPEIDTQGNTEWLKKLPGINQRINPFLYDLRTCLRPNSKANYPRFPQAVHLTLVALLKGLNFDRAVFFKVSESKIKVGLAMGVRLFEPHLFERTLTKEHGTPEFQAFNDKTPIFTGEPIFSEGWPFAVFPAIWQNQVIGLFYADRIRRPDVDNLTNQEQIACTALAEEWRDIPIELL